MIRRKKEVMSSRDVAMGFIYHITKSIGVLEEFIHWYNAIRPHEYRLE
ncbi:MAG: hypothetical protein QXT63_08615 [Thermoplasmata archaeon]